MVDHMNQSLENIDIQNLTFYFYEKLDYHEVVDTFNRYKNILVSVIKIIKPNFLFTYTNALLSALIATLDILLALLIYLDIGNIINPQRGQYLNISIVVLIILAILCYLLIYFYKKSIYRRQLLQFIIQLREPETTDSIRIFLQNYRFREEKNIVSK